MQDCHECRRLEALLEKTAIEWFALVTQVSSLPDTDPQKPAAITTLRGADDAKNDAQQQFSQHRAKHQPKQLVQTA